MQVASGIGKLVPSHYARPVIARVSGFSLPACRPCFESNMPLIALATFRIRNLSTSFLYHMAEPS